MELTFSGAKPAGENYSRWRGEMSKFLGGVGYSPPFPSMENPTFPTGRISHFPLTLLTLVD